MPSLEIGWVIAIDASQPESSVCNLLGPQGGVVTVGLLDDVLKEARVRFRGIGGRPAVVVMSVLIFSFLCGSGSSSPLGKDGLESIAGVFDGSILGVFG